MFFLLSKIFWMLVAPSSQLGLSMVGGALALLAGWRRLAGVLIGYGVLLILAISMTPLPYIAMASLEDRFPRPDVGDMQVAGIVVLGGAVSQVIFESREVVALNDSAERMTEAAALAIRFPEARLVFTGGSGLLNQDGGGSEADVAAIFFRDAGIAMDRISFEGRSRNTHENAVFSRDLARPQPGEVWLLVTSAAHMPRAVAVFQAADWPVLPFPVDYRTYAPSARGWDMPGLAPGLDLLDFAIHEWVGLAAYYATGRTRTMLPPP